MAPLPNEHEYEGRPDTPRETPPPSPGDEPETVGRPQADAYAPTAEDQATTVPGGEDGPQRAERDAPKIAAGSVAWIGGEPVYVAAENDDGSYVVGRFSSYETYRGGLDAEYDAEAQA